MRKKLGVLRSTNEKVYTLINLHLNGLFRETIFRPLGGAAPLNFYTR